MGDQAAEQAYAVVWVAASCMSCLVYDHALTFGQEIDRMWSGSWSIPKILFFVNRYVVEAIIIFNSIASSLDNLSISFCKFYLRWLVCTITITNAVVEGILVARVCAVYRTTRVILALAIFVYTSGVCVLVGLTITDYVGESVSVDNVSILPGCYAASVPSLIAGYWITSTIVESVLFVLMAIRVFVWRREQERVPATLVLLARDSTAYFTIIFVLLITNLFVFEYGPPFLSSMMVTPSNTAGCIAGSRMLLNLRALTDPDVAEIELTNFSTLNFGRQSEPYKTNSTTVGGKTTTSL